MLGETWTQEREVSEGLQTVIGSARDDGKVFAFMAWLFFICNEVKGSKWAARIANAQHIGFRLACNGHDSHIVEEYMTGGQSSHGRSKVHNFCFPQKLRGISMAFKFNATTILPCAIVPFVCACGGSEAVRLSRLGKKVEMRYLKFNKACSYCLAFFSGLCHCNMHFQFFLSLLS